MVDYLYKQRYFLCFCLGISLLAFGFEISNLTISIDEEYGSLIERPNPGWISADRWGMYILNLFLMPGPSLPYYPIILGILLNLGTLLICLELWDAQERRERYLAAVFALTMPTIAFVYQFNIAQYGYYTGFFLTALGVQLFVQKSNKFSLALVIILWTFAISIYQSTVFVAPVIYLIYLLTKMIDHPDQHLWDKGSLSRNLLRMALALGLSVICHQVISLIVRNIAGVTTRYHTVNNFFSGSFLEAYSPILAGKEILAFLIGHKWSVGWIAGFLMVICIILLSKFLIQTNWKLKHKVISLLILAGAILSPFTLVLATGSIWPTRTMMALPILFAGIIYLASRVSTTRVRYLIVIIVGMSFFHFMRINTKLFYADHVVWNNDVRLANRLISRAEGVLENPHAGPTPLVIVGVPARSNLLIAPEYETFGGSLFSWDGGLFHRVNRIFQLMNVDYFSPPTSAQYQTGFKLAAQMDVWPASNSIIMHEGIMVMKFSEPTVEQLAKIK